MLDTARKEDPEVRFSYLLGDLPTWFATPEIRISCPDEHKHAIVQRLAERISSMLASGAVPAELREEVEGVVTLDGLRLTGGHGWGLIRASNTEPALILRFEAASRDKMQQLQTFLEDQMAAVQRDLGAVS